MRLATLFLTLCSVIRNGIASETVKDAAGIARRLVEYSPDFIGTMATVYPNGHDLAGTAFPLQEYYAPCHNNGSLTLLFLPISRHSQNILHSPSRAASITVASEHPRASRARVTFMGNVTIISDTDVSIPEIKKCYLDKHRDARWWLPGDDDGAHISHWARFDPHTIYFVGGFGDSHYIGYIPLDLYQSTTALPSDISRDIVDVARPTQVPLAGRLMVIQGDHM